MQPIISVQKLSKSYASGFRALKDINLDIRRGEIFALLGPNGAGKTTLIGIICGILVPTQGKVTVDGHDIINDYRAARSLIGLVPQELHTDAFESVWATVSFSRGLFNKPKNPAYIEKVLRALSLWDKKDNKIMTLSGGMKRRVLIAKALSHEPQILFLDEPTAGVDVELRKDMWQVVRELRDSGVTIILTTHYIEEAEDMADRVGVINKGEIILVENKAELMRKLGKKQLDPASAEETRRHAGELAGHHLTLSDDGADAHLHLRHPRRAHRRHHAAWPISTACRHPLPRPGDPAKFAGRYFRRTGERPTMNLTRRHRDLHLRDGAHRAHHLAEHRLAGALDFALFRGVRRRHRLAHHGDRRRLLRRLHRARADHADAAHAEHDERILRHLLSALHRHDLRDPVGAGLAVRNRARLCRARRRPSRSSSG